MGAGVVVIILLLKYIIIICTVKYYLALVALKMEWNVKRRINAVRNYCILNMNIATRSFNFSFFYKYVAGLVL